MSVRLAKIQTTKQKALEIIRVPLVVSVGVSCADVLRGGVEGVLEKFVKVRRYGCVVFLAVKRASKTGYFNEMSFILDFR